MATTANFTFGDASKEKSSMGFYLPEITALNYAGVTQDLDEVLDFIRGDLTDAPLFDVSFTRVFPDDLVTTFPVDQDIQRERKWLVTMRDVKRNLDTLNTILNTSYGKLFSFEIPCAKVTGNLNGSDFIEESSLVFQGAKAVFEANIRSPWNWAAFSSPTDLQFTELISIKKVGRNT